MKSRRIFEKLVRSADIRFFEREALSYLPLSSTRLFQLDFNDHASIAERSAPPAAPKNSRLRLSGEETPTR